jgi:hypothetical protein
MAIFTFFRIMAIENLKKHLILSLKILYIAFWQYLDTPKFFLKKTYLKQEPKRSKKRSQNPTYYRPKHPRQPRALLAVPFPLAASETLQVQSLFFFLQARVFFYFLGFFFFFLNWEFFVFHGQIGLVVFSDQFFSFIEAAAHWRK